MLQILFILRNKRQATEASHVQLKPMPFFHQVDVSQLTMTGVIYGSPKVRSYGEIMTSYQACLVFQRLPRGASFRLQEARTRDQDRDAGAGVVRVPVGRGNEGKVRAVAQHAAA